MLGWLASRTARVGAICWAAAVWCEPAHSQMDTTREELTRELRAVFDSRVPESGWGAALVSRGGVDLLTACRGADASGSPLSVDSIVDIGDVSASFTAAGILRLQMQGKLSVTDPLSRFVPDVPEDKRGITLLHLLTQTSGIAGDLILGDGRSTREGMLARVLEAPLIAAPGTAFKYSHLNGSVLAAVIELASGESFEAWMQREVFLRAGLKDTGLVGAPPAARERFARRIGNVGQKLLSTSLEDYPWNWSYRGALGVLSSLRDLQRWHVAVTSGPMLDGTARHLMRAPLANGATCGWHVDMSRRSTALLDYEGTARGFQTYLICVDANDLVIAVTAREITDVVSLGRELLQVVMPVPGGAPTGTRKEPMPPSLAPAVAPALSEPLLRGNLRIASCLAEQSGQSVVRTWPLWDVRRFPANADHLYCGIVADVDTQPTWVADLYVPLETAHTLATELEAAGTDSSGSSASADEASTMELSFPAATDDERRTVAARAPGWPWRLLPPPLELHVTKTADDPAASVLVDVTSRGTRVLSLQFSTAAAREWACRLRNALTRGMH